MLPRMDIDCPNYEISIPSDGTERMITFSAEDVLSRGVNGGNPVALCVFTNGARVELEDGTRVLFPDLPGDLRKQLMRHATAWVCAVVDEDRHIGVQWAGCIAIQAINENMERAQGAS